jgi:hypothetical protein
MVYHAEDFVCEGNCICGPEIWILSDRRKSHLFAPTDADVFVENHVLRVNDMKTFCFICAFRATVYD